MTFARITPHALQHGVYHSVGYTFCWAWQRGVVKTPANVVMLDAGLSYSWVGKTMTRRDQGRVFYKNQS